MDKPPKTETAVFAGGCFWCTEAVFRSLAGVIEVEPGYAGGTVASPTYEQVSAGKTGHAEAIRFTYDPALVTYDDLLAVFFATHDPTTVDRQGNDVGPQYRSVVFFTSNEQKDTAQTLIARLNASGELGDPIVTTVEPLARFWPAEDYHKQYFEHHKDATYCQLVINPKLQKLKEKFAELLKSR